MNSVKGGHIPAGQRWCAARDSPPAFTPRLKCSAGVTCLHRCAASIKNVNSSPIDFMRGNINTSLFLVCISTFVVKIFGS